MPYTHYICIQMMRKELTKIFAMIIIWKKTFGLHSLYKNISTLWYTLCTAIHNLRWFENYL